MNTANSNSNRVDPKELAARVMAGDRAALARAITLVESRRADHRASAGELLGLLMPKTGKAIRIGMTGVPGVGKSTLIDTFASNLTNDGHKVAVLAVDPSSSRTGGSLLGDKTRMAKLAKDPNAFIRPSPAAGTLGGVAARTREAMLVCEAAGFDVIIVETVGIGQSETAVADMVDVFVALMLPGAGDELQGIKKGVVEIADIIAVNKADGAGAKPAGAAAAEYRAALRILTPSTGGETPVLTVSGLANQGLDELWQTITGFHVNQTKSGALEARRAAQAVRWFHTLLDERLRDALFGSAEAKARLKAVEEKVHAGEMDVAEAVEVVVRR
jgi:LAO/AO transport system kinase